MCVFKFLFEYIVNISGCNDFYLICFYNGKLIIFLFLDGYNVIVYLIEGKKNFIIFIVILLKLMYFDYK